ncbi:IS3 family transposase [Providencia rettgeri]|nr:IS3 family transposase [Providencia rettgeri]
MRLRALVREAHESSHGSAGTRTIADIVSNTKQVPLTHYRATNLMKLLGLVSCQTPNIDIKKRLKSTLQYQIMALSDKAKFISAR